MRLTFVRIQNGKRRMVWSLFVLYVAASFGLTIGSAELFWKLFSGDFSPLIALLALFVSTLIVVRAILEAFALPVHVHETWLVRHDD